MLLSAEGGLIIGLSGGTSARLAAVAVTFRIVHEVRPLQSLTVPAVWLTVAVFYNSAVTNPDGMTARTQRGKTCLAF